MRAAATGALLGGKPPSKLHSTPKERPSNFTRLPPLAAARNTSSLYKDGPAPFFFQVSGPTLAAAFAKNKGAAS